MSFEFLLIFGSIFLPLVGVWLKNFSDKVSTSVVAIGASILFFFSIFLLKLDFSSFFQLFLSFASFLFFFLLLPFFKRSGDYSFEFPLLIFFSVLGQLFLLTSSSLISFFLCLEISSLSLYALTIHSKNFSLSTEAGLKYFILGALSSFFYLFGCLGIYGFFGFVDFESIRLLGFYEFNILIFPCVCIIFALLFKLAAVPAHWWVGDVYGGASLLVVGFFSCVTKVAFVVSLAKLVWWVFPYDFIASSLQFAGLASVVVGSIGALYYTQLKQFIAFSSIVHIGYLMLAISVNTVFGFFSFTIYLVVYVFLNLSFFSILLSSVGGIANFRTIYDFSTFFQSEKIVSYNLIVNLFSFAGIPPFVGFVSKMLVFVALLDSNCYLSVFTLLTFSVISSVYYIRFFKFLLFDRSVRWIKFSVFAWTGSVISVFLFFSSTFFLISFPLYTFFSCFPLELLFCCVIWIKVVVE